MPSVIHRRRIIYPGSGGFLPSQISNLGFWLESDYGITRDGSNAVSEWIARGSRGYTLSQATGANQPIWTANEFGSQAGLIFDGTNDSLDRTVSNPFGDVQTFSVFIVAKATTANAGQNYFYMGDTAGTNYYGFVKLHQTYNSAFTTDSNSGTANWIYGNTALDNNLPYLAISEGDGSVWAERVNRTNQSLTVGGGSNNGQAPGDFTTLDNIVIGGLKRSTNTFVVSNFAAILFYERQLLAAERTRVENYLISKYGIAA